MNQKPTKGWFKHADFIILDLIMMQISFALAYWCIHREIENPYAVESYRYLAVVFAFSQIASALFTRNYSGIVRRGYYKVDNDLLFKMDDDPRIIGSEKKDRNGRPKGIGNFIRNTSIDEFPQFFNVLKGDRDIIRTTK